MNEPRNPSPSYPPLPWGGGEAEGPHGRAPRAGEGGEGHAAPVLELRDLVTEIRGRRGAIRVVDEVSLTVGPGEIVGLTHGGLATSSTVARRWDTASGPAHHVIDPRTGRPAAGPVRTATVWAASAVQANTGSTAALVWGESAEARLRLAGASARLVRTDGTVRTVGEWPRDGVAA